MSLKEQKNKIAIFIYSMGGGGAERVTSYLLPFLKMNKENVILILMNDMISYELPDDIPIHYLEKSNGDEAGIFKFLKLPYLSYKYARLMKREKITHSFSLLTRPSYINVLSRYLTSHKYKVGISERNYPSLQYGRPGSQGKINTFLVKKLYHKADLCISNAQASADDLIKNYGVSPEKMKVIYNPIDYEKIFSIESVEDFYDKAYINLVTVGRLQKVKNHAFLINSIKGFDNVRLYIIGEGNLRKSLEAQINELNLSKNVFLLGFETNPFKYLKGADLFIFGSNHEGFPNVIMEAMACGLPILTTNCKSGPNEMMELDPGKESENDLMFTSYGILTPVGNENLIRKGLNYMIDNPKFIDSCKTNVIERIKDFKKDSILKKYYNYIIE